MKRRKKIKEKNLINNFNYINSFIAENTIDFHEFGILTHFDIEKLLSEFIEDSYVSDYKNLLIIVGKGHVVRPLVNKLLKTNKYVESFKRASYFNGQDGAFEVRLFN